MVQNKGSGILRNLLKHFPFFFFFFQSYQPQSFEWYICICMDKTKKPGTWETFDNKFQKIKEKHLFKTPPSMPPLRGERHWTDWSVWHGYHGNKTWGSWGYEHCSQT